MIPSEVGKPNNIYKLCLFFCIRWSTSTKLYQVIPNCWSVSKFPERYVVICREKWQFDKNLSQDIILVSVVNWKTFSRRRTRIRFNIFTFFYDWGNLKWCICKAALVKCKPLWNDYCMNWAICATVRENTKLIVNRRE